MPEGIIIHIIKLFRFVLGLWKHRKRSITDSYVDDQHRQFFYLLFVNVCINYAYTLLGASTAHGIPFVIETFQSRRFP